MEGKYPSETLRLTQGGNLPQEGIALSVGSPSWLTVLRGTVLFVASHPGRLVQKSLPMGRDLLAHKTVRFRLILLAGICPRRESNPHCRFRRPMFYPLNYQGRVGKVIFGEGILSANSFLGTERWPLKIDKRDIRPKNK